MLVIGVTGGIGGGKTEVCKLFAGLGATVVHADALARRIMEQDVAVRKRLTDMFGDDIYAVDGKLNRTLLADIVFVNKKFRKKLDSAVHPYVLRALLRIIREEISKGTELLVIEAALIFESGADEMMDFVVVVEANEEARIRRVMRRDGSGRKKVQSRIAAQMSTERRLRKADFVIYNDDDFVSLEAKVTFLHKLFSTMVHDGEDFKP